MIAPSLPFVPPAPKIPPKDLPLWKAIPASFRSTLEIWPDYAFDVDFNRRRSLGVELFLINDPQDIRHVLTNNAANYRRPMATLRIVRPLGGDGVFLAEGEAWRRQRRLLAPTFTPAAVSRLIPHLQAAGAHLLRGIEGEDSVNLSEAFQDVALETVFRALFSMPENESREKLSALGRSYVNGPGRPGLLDFLARSENAFPFAARGRKRFQDVWFAAIDAVIAERRAPGPAREAKGPAGEAKDLLDMLIALRDADTGESLTDAELRSQCATMGFAGSETTARMMFWAVYLLSQDHAEQERLRAEIAAFPPERAQNLDDLQNWPRLRNVLLEALRLYPPIAHITREAVGPDEIHGVKIPPGAQLWISPWVMHRHRKYWDNPTAFLPDRFAGKPAPWIQTPAYIPFGAGPRICIGLGFALAEAQIVLAQLLARYRIGLSGEKPVLPVARVTIEPSYEPLFRLERL
jgi:cytochrome P450